MWRLFTSACFVSRLNCVALPPAVPLFISAIIEVVNGVGGVAASASADRIYLSSSFR